MSYPRRQQLDPDVRTALDGVVAQMEEVVRVNGYLEIAGHQMRIADTTPVIRSGEHIGDLVLQTDAPDAVTPTLRIFHRTSQAYVQPTLAGMTFAGPFIVTGEIDPITIGGGTTYNDWEPTGIATAFHITMDNASSGDDTLTGIAGGTAGRMLVLTNRGTGTDNLDLANDSGSSVAANRIKTPGAATHSISSQTSAVLLYDGQQSRWVVASSS